MEQEYCISNLELVAGFNNRETVFFPIGKSSFTGSLYFLFFRQNDCTIQGKFKWLVKVKGNNVNWHENWNQYENLSYH